MECSEELCGWVDELDLRLGDRLTGYVWWCGDEWCNCSQAKITLRRKMDQIAFYENKDVWLGVFHSDGEGLDEIHNSLNRMAQHLRRHHKEFYRRVQWPWSHEGGG